MKIRRQGNVECNVIIAMDAREFTVCFCVLNKIMQFLPNKLLFAIFFFKKKLKSSVMERQLHVCISGNENNHITIEKICYTKKNACIIYISHLCIDYI